MVTRVFWREFLFFEREAPPATFRSTPLGLAFCFFRFSNTPSEAFPPAHPLGYLCQHFPSLGVAVGLFFRGRHVLRVRRLLQRRNRRYFTHPVYVASRYFQ